MENVTTMMVEETKAKISEEFMSRFYEWLKDEKELSDHDYGWKYGWCKSKEPHKDNIKAVVSFQKYIFDATRTYPEWERKGYNGQSVTELWRQGFLSNRMYKWKEYYYISQRTAKEIWKAYKA